jgi:hypothetical protein
MTARVACPQVLGPRTTRGRLAFGLAALGGIVLVASALRSWVEPAHVAWPSYADGVPDLIARPSDIAFRLLAGLAGAAALVLVAVARHEGRRTLAWLLVGALGLGTLAVGLAGLQSAADHPGFGSMVANDMTLSGFRHGALNYVELAGASLLCLSPLAALRASRSTGR